MACLHIINRSPYERIALHSCLQHVCAGDGILLIEDAVVASLAGTRYAEQLLALEQVSVYVLAPDLVARGLSQKVTPSILAVDYAGFVDLTVEYAHSQSWL